MYGLILTWLLTIVGTVGAFKRPLIGLYIYIGFSVLRPQFLFGWAGNMESLSFIVGLATILGWMLNGAGDWKLARARSIFALLVAYTLWSLLSSFNARSVEPAMAFMQIFLKTLLPFLVGITMLDSTRRVWLMLWTIALCLGYLSFELNYSYLHGYNQVQDMGFGGMDGPSIGIVLVAGFGVTAGLTVFATRWRERVAGGISLLLILHATLLTYSRGAFVGLLAIGATAFLLLPKRPKYLAGMLVVGLIALRFTGPELKARYMTTFAQEQDRDSSAASRLALWRDCMLVIGDNPMLGVGPNNWTLIAAEYGWSDGKEAHSVWMQTAAEVGIPGVAMLLGFYVLAMGKMWMRVRIKKGQVLNPEEVSAGAGIVMGLAGFIVSAQFVSLKGLELPFYIVMCAMALIKSAGLAPAAVPEAIKPLTPGRYLHPAMRDARRPG